MLSPESSECPDVKNYMIKGVGTTGLTAALAPALLKVSVDLKFLCVGLVYLCIVKL